MNAGINIYLILAVFAAKGIVIIFKKLFSVSNSERPWYSVILWWELRRIPYNFIVGICGFLSLLLMGISGNIPPKPSFEEQDFEPLSIIIFAFLANIFYTGGWISEFIARKLWKEKAESFGPIAFSLGVIFSIFLAFLPGIASFLSWIIRFIKK